MRNPNIKSMVQIALFAALIGALAYVSIPLPISPVPITGQTLAILLAGLLLSPRDAASAVGLWILMGVFGLPVFSKARSGFMVLLGPSGGYILGFLACAAFIAFTKGKHAFKSASPVKVMTRYFVVSALGSFFVVYAFGVCGMMLTLGMTFDKALTAGVLPFLIGDGLKVVIAVLGAYQIQRSAPNLFHN